MKYAAGIEYDGTRFSGWQIQSHAPSVQAAVEEALSKVADVAVEVVASGRTDAGVHAIGQVAHFESGVAREPREWLRGANANLPDDVALRWVRPVAGDFHARFSARRRGYRYVILNRAERSPLYRYRSAFVHQPLDADAMRRSAQALVGEHDFSSFRAAGCRSRSPVRRVFEIVVRRCPNAKEFIEITVTADAFVQHMVRNVAGALIAVGAGERPGAWVAELLAARDRTRGGVTADACGLYLLGVEYDEHYKLPRLKVIS